MQQLWLRLMTKQVVTCPEVSVRYFSARMKPGQRDKPQWFQEKRKVYPTQLALKHFDGYYSKVYGRKWPSIRLGLLCPNKFAAVINPLCDVSDIEQQFKMMRKVDLRRYYEKHWKHSERYKLRMSILKERKDKKKTEAIAKGLEEPESDIDEHISESEFQKRNLGHGFSSAAEDAHRLFESEFEDNNDRFLNSASTNLNLNDFVPSSEFITQEEETMVTSTEATFKADQKFEINFTDEPKLKFPESLRVYVNARGVIGYESHVDEKDETDSSSEFDGEEEQVVSNQSTNSHCFPHPTLDKQLKIWNYYLMDAASILPVLLLDIQKGHVVADYCAAPGGKGLSILFTLMPNKLLLNEQSESRFLRLKAVIRGYVGKNSPLNDLVEFKESDARQLIRPDQFDRILLDVPCSNDRVSVNVNENNLFSHMRVKERLQLPVTQTELLLAGLRSLNVGGALVYSTCSLSPIQNDGVVEAALKQLSAQSNFRFEVRKLKETLRPLRSLYRLYHFHYGEQVVPFLPSNAGPLYISKIVRLE